jgi:hypothetical protein
MRWRSYQKENRAISGIQFVIDGKGRKVGVLIDLKKHGAIWEEFWDGLMSESRREEKGILTNNTAPPAWRARGRAKYALERAD